ncbi:MarR family winged helix-turn-helix transcriptional regulator [Acidovorax delafieldii]|uniref:MarR family winged helix-turn-helix transcriptional regulator n=1 Tax=Acidovorax delafieldii TaxID=47920 RepID=UPI0012FE7784|nr:MarR family transcriptional regulator [Acidovorax delafieldii]
MSPSPKALAESLREVVGDFVRLTRDQAGTPSTARSETLGILDRQGSMSIASLAAHRNVRHQSMRLVVAQLESESLVARMSDPADGRSQLITLTHAGTEFVRLSRHARSLHIETAIAAELSEQERQDLAKGVSVLKRLLMYRRE